MWKRYLLDPIWTLKSYSLDKYFNTCPVLSQWDGAQRCIRYFGINCVQKNTESSGTNLIQSCLNTCSASVTEQKTCTEDGVGGRHFLSSIHLVLSGSDEDVLQLFKAAKSNVMHSDWAAHSSSVALHPPCSSFPGYPSAVWFSWVVQSWMQSRRLVPFLSLLPARWVLDKVLLCLSSFCCK